MDSIQWLIQKCQEDESTASSYSGTNEVSKLWLTTSGSPGDSTDKNETHYDNPLLNELTAHADTHARLQRAVLASDRLLLLDPDQTLPGETLIGDLVGDIELLGSRLARITENMELLGWRLLESRFTVGLDLPYQQHGSVHSLLRQMAALISNVSGIEERFMKAASYKTNRKVSENLTKAIRCLLDQRARLENVESLRHNASIGSGKMTLHDSDL